MNDTSSEFGGGESVKADVIIAGAGPVGLLLANFLGAQGVQTLVCERRRGPVEASMAIGVTPPSLEILRPLGLDEALVENGVPVRYAEVLEEGAVLGRLDFDGIDTDYPFFLSVPQARTVEMLRENLRKYPCVSLREGVELMRLSQDAEGVTSRWRTPQGLHYPLRSKFLAGCDGHRSAVRSEAALVARGKTYPQKFIMGDFDDRSDLGAEARLFFGAKGSVESFPLPGGKRRWILQVDAPPSVNLAERLVSDVLQRTGYDLSNQLANHVSAFGAKRLVVSRYYNGRVALAGDAAHVMSSIGGQCMNTGFADAEYLARVFAGALKNPAGLEAALAEYDTVRRIAFEAAARRAEMGMRLGTMRGVIASHLRRHFIRRVLFSGVVRPKLAPHFAMLTIPFCNLQRSRVTPRSTSQGIHALNLQHSS